MTAPQHKRRTLVAWLEDKPGVLSRVTGLFSRRNFNIESLAVGPSEQPGISRMTFVVRGTDRDLNQVNTQLDKLINVVAIEDVTDRPTVIREMALIKVSAPGSVRGEILQLVDIYRASVVDVDLDALIIQIVGPEDRVESLIRLLGNFGIEEMVRTGRVAMARGATHPATAPINEPTVALTNGNGHLN
jgi:acetolactate synthase-1/3 small subunit